MLTAEGRTANALGGKTARACESCLRKRARWFCAADDAFLCQSCDSSVHSANQLASRHERVRIETSSSSSFNFRSTESKLHDQISDPVWHHGFTRKARTPRHHQKPPVLKKDNNNNIVNSLNSSLPLVPEIGVEENNSPDENDDEQFLYRVPVFDPLFFGGGGDSNNEIESFLNDEFIDSDAKLAELAADVENLLGSTTELDEDLAAAGVVSNNFIASDFMNNNRVKIEEDDEDEEVQAVIASHFDPALDSARESLSWDFDYSSSSPVIGGDEDLETKMMIELPENEFETKPEGMRKIFLKLNYDDIINTWDSQNCPWTNGTRPDFNCHDFVVCMPLLFFLVHFKIFSKVISETFFKTIFCMYQISHS